MRIIRGKIPTREGEGESQTHQACLPWPKEMKSLEVFTNWCFKPSPSPLRIFSNRNASNTSAFAYFVSSWCIGRAAVTSTVPFGMNVPSFSVMSFTVLRVRPTVGRTQAESGSRSRAVRLEGQRMARTDGDPVVAGRLPEQAVELPHLRYGSLGPAVCCDDGLDLFPKWLNAFGRCGEVVKHVGNVLAERDITIKVSLEDRRDERMRTVEDVWMAAKFTRNILSTMLTSEWFRRTASSMIHWSTSFYGSRERTLSSETLRTGHTGLSDQSSPKAVNCALLSSINGLICFIAWAIVRRALLTMRPTTLDRTVNE